MGRNADTCLFHDQPIWINGKHFGTMAPGPALTLSITDWLGSDAVRTDPAGNLQAAFCSLPFGDGLTTCLGADPLPSDPTHFTGKERDTESGLDYFGARYYASSVGRFTSPDPSGLSYADPSNPQSLNLYSYALNNPLSNIDPSGLECVWDDGSYDAADDPDTGKSNDCSSRGGKWVDPNLFENAMLTNGQNANIQYGSWSGQANSTIASSWLDPSSITTASPINSITINVPMAVWNFAAQQVKPVNGLWSYGNWAGSDGMGAPVNDVDAGAMMHDYCYHQGGFTAGSNFRGYNASLQACNQALCDTVSPIAKGQGQNMTDVDGSEGMTEQNAAKDIVSYFSIVPWGNACKSSASRTATSLIIE